jgi:hypothetical protein
MPISLSDTAFIPSCPSSSLHGLHLISWPVSSSFLSPLPLPTKEGFAGIEGPEASMTQRVLFGLGSVALPYVWGRLNKLAAQMEWNERM